MRWQSLLIPLVSALIPVFVYRYSRRFASHPVLGALLAGAVVAVLAFAAFQVPVLREAHALARATLCGILVTESLLFHSQGIPSLTSTSLLLFLYFYSTEHGISGK